ncbi:fatty-acid amide hydrolase 2-like isoform X2 [Scyliorhinus torazame]|uniref:fatty-acid amide hydrolase 2-like isoform X2 n=1 Tax=Scyliorhinus torazame TaxID=75743 RepID=UPI003B5AC5FA
MVWSVLERSLVLLLRGASRLLLALLSLAQSFGPRNVRPVPPAVRPLLLLSGVELARRIRQKQIKCVDVIQEYISRIRDVNPIINAVVAERFAAALKEAKEVDNRIAEGGEDVKSLEESVPYLGVPFTVKEAIALEGGEGCIIAAAGSVMGVGSDIGGSIRMPAFFNGIYGHKPTTGLVPNGGQFPNATGRKAEFLCTGPMCRYVEDLIPMLKVMAGPNISKVKLDEEVFIKKVKFYSMEHDGGSPFVSKVDSELIRAQRKLTEYLEVQFGVQVQQVQIHKMKYAFQIWSAMMVSPETDGKESRSFKELMADHGKEIRPLWELVKKILGLSPHTIPAIGLVITEDLAKANHQSNVKLMNMSRNLQNEFSNLLGDDGVFLYPSHPKIAPRHHHPKLMPFNFAYTAIFNVLGLPVTQCPLGLSKDGLPLGIQLVANHHNDHLCLRVAQHLECAFGGWRNPGAP